MQFLYHFSKVNGLVPFHVDFDKKRAFACTNSVLYSIAFTFIFSTYLTYYVYILSVLVIDINEDLVVRLVLVVDMVTALVKAVLVYVLQLVRRHELIKSINSFIKICEWIFEPEINQKLRFSAFFNRKLTNSCWIKCISFGFQITLLLIAYSFSDYNISLNHTIQNGIIIFYTNTTNIVVTSLFYCGGMLFSARFYQILDEKIERLSKSIDENHNDDLARTVDQISCLYEHITVFTSSISRIYAFQLIVSLIAIIVWILASVRNQVFVH